MNTDVKKLEVKNNIIELLIRGRQTKVAVIEFGGTGYLDCNTFVPFAEVVEELVQKQEIYFIVIDFAALKYISSAGLGVLLGCWPEIRNKNGCILLYGMNSKMKYLFDMLGFSRLIRIVEKLEDAKQFLQQLPPVPATSPDEYPH